MESNRKYEIDKKNRIFTKYYSDYDDKSKIDLEYRKGISLSSIINYPKPINFSSNYIKYELIDIKYSLYDLLIKGEAREEQLKKNREIFKKDS